MYVSNILSPLLLLISTSLATARTPNLKRATPGAPGMYPRAECPRGQYSASGNTPCQNCPVGYYAASTGTRICTPARAGYYVSEPGSTTDKKCGSGTYSSLLASTQCTPCPAGSQCLGEGNTSPTLCPAGRYSSGNGQSCAACPAGSFNSIPGATSCCLCCAGRYSSSAGSDSCSTCPASAPYSDPGSTTPQKCSSTKGLYQPALTCLQIVDTRACPASMTYPTGSYKRSIYPKTCPTSGHKSCPIFKNTRKRTSVLAGYECVDVANDLESCGGCVNYSSIDGERSEDGGRDCSSISNVDAVSCVLGQCIINSCKPKYEVSSDGESCVSKTSNSLLQQLLK